MRKARDKGKGCCNNRLLMVFAASLFMLLALALSASAQFQCNVSTSVTTIKGGSNVNQVNITFSTGFSTSTATNRYAEIYIYSASTANSSSTALTANVSNSTSANSVNWTLPVSLGFIFEDGNDYAINAIVWNGTVNTLGQGATNKTPCNNASAVFTVDRTVPSAATSLSPSGIQTADDLTFSATVNGANTTGCTLIFDGKNPGTVEYSMTHSGDTCTYSLNNVPLSSYNWKVRASDGTNTTDSSVTTFEIDQKTTAAKKAFVASGGKVLPATASQTTQQKAFGQQGALSSASFDKEKVKEGFKKEIQGRELAKTGGGAVVGGLIGASGFLGGPLGFITMPVGAIIGGAVGAWA